MSMYNDVFLANVTDDFHKLGGQSEKQGMKAIIEGFEKYFPDGDRRWLAYMLSTAFHETAMTMQPVREAFWLSENWRKTHLSYYPYYGRGYVQLTHKGNYKRAGDDIDVDLVSNPDMAMNPQHAAHIMFIGMRDGWFRSDAHGKHTLGRYFSKDVDDPVGARNIINGKETKVIDGKTVTVAEIMAGYHKIFLHALNAAAPGADMVGAGLDDMVAPGDTDGGAGPGTASKGALKSARFQQERVTLMSLASPLSLDTPMARMIDYRDAKRPASHPRYWAIIDFNQRSDKKRLHLFDMEAKTVDHYLCAHGKASDPENDGMATSFSNDDGSSKSSLGIYLCAETYFGEHGYSMRLDGLENSNSHARHRAIVVHPADYVSDSFASENHRVGRSLGCPAVDAKYSVSIIDRLKEGSLMIAWHW
jgi:hypothetical protein